jgi:hypothetical protein
MHVMIRVAGEEQKEVKFRLWAESPQKLGRLADELTSVLGFFGCAEMLSVSCQSRLEVEGKMKLSGASWSSSAPNVVGEVISRLLCAFGWKEDRHTIALDGVTIELEQAA